MVGVGGRVYGLVGDILAVDRLEDDSGEEEEDGKQLDGQFEEGEEL